MSQLTIQSNNFSGYTADITFYPFSGGSISYGSQVIPYTITTDNFNGEYTMDMTFNGVPVSCGLQVGASPCVDITASGATTDFSGTYTYLGQGYLSWTNTTNNWQIVCSDTDPKSHALYWYENPTYGTFIMGNVYDNIPRTEEFQIVLFSLFSFPSGPQCSDNFFNSSYSKVCIPQYNNGFPLEGNFTSGVPNQGTYLLDNNPSCVDADAAAYLADVITSGGTIDATMSAATNTLFTELKSAGLYSKIYTMYPYLGGTAASNSINAKLDKSFDITWNGGMTHDISGSTGNGTNAYGDTGFNPQVEIGSAVGISSHSSVYVGTETASPDESEFGYRFGFGNDNWVMAVSLGNVYYGWQYSQGALYAVDFSNADAKGNYIQSRTSTTSLVVYKNGSLQDTNTTTSITSAPNANLRVFTDSIRYSDRRLQFTTIGDGLSASEITTLDGIINTFQTTLGRNTY